MAYFPDNSPYEYWKPRVDALNIGWLAKGQPFTTGEAPKGLVDRLKRCCHDIGVNQTRGLHGCDFCDDPFAYRTNTDLGSAEIWAFGADGTIFAAPTLIIHYIEAHGYRPPQPFIDAVMQGPMPPDPVYLDRLDALGIEYSNWADLRARHPGKF